MGGAQRALCGMCVGVAIVAAWDTTSDERAEPSLSGNGWLSVLCGTRKSGDRRRLAAPKGEVALGYRFVFTTVCRDVVILLRTLLLFVSVYGGVGRVVVVVVLF